MYMTGMQEKIKFQPAQGLLAQVFSSALSPSERSLGEQTKNEHSSRKFRLKKNHNKRKFVFTKLVTLQAARFSCDFFWALVISSFL
jgi:hypothetical protein